MPENPDRMEEAARAAMRAIAGTVTGAPPLQLPAAPARPAPGRHRWRGRGLIIPLAAAAAVMAIASGLAVLHQAHHGLAASAYSPSSPAAPHAMPGQVSRATGSPACGGLGAAANAAAPGVPADVPRYFVEECPGPVNPQIMGPIGGPTVRGPGRLVVAETRTGAILGSVPPPSGAGELTGIYGTAGNRAFVLSAYVGPGPRTALWVLRLQPGTARPVTLTRLRWTLDDVTSLAVSPDGTRIAASFRVLSKGKPVLSTPVRMYSLATGTVLRAWVTSGIIDALQWTGDGRGIAYELGGSAFAVHDIAAPGSDFSAGSTALLSLPPGPAETLNTACGLQSGWAVSANGTTITCPSNSQGARSDTVQWNVPAPGTGRCPAGSPRAQLAFARFAAGAHLPGTPPAGTSYSVTTCASSADFVGLLWASADGTEVIGQLAYPGHDEVGVFYAGSYVPLPAIRGGAPPLIAF